MFENVTAAAAHEHVRDLRTVAERDRQVAELRYRVTRRDRDGRVAGAR